MPNLKTYKLPSGKTFTYDGNQPSQHLILDAVKRDREQTAREKAMAANLSGITPYVANPVHAAITGAPVVLGPGTVQVGETTYDGILGTVTKYGPDIQRTAAMLGECRDCSPSEIGNIIASNVSAAINPQPLKAAPKDGLIELSLFKGDGAVIAIAILAFWYLSKR